MINSKNPNNKTKCPDCEFQLNFPRDLEKGEILKALDRATEGLKFSSDEATKQALNARIVALRNALLLSQFMSYNPADAKQVLVKGVMAA